ncbi:exopolyphosphatase [Selenomonas sp. ND2010]|uniref:Ppx/GppA phosphatase family protein n=1 Tax=Selenomonas sp. ND2010 TaxID=1410618 RepID=UPI00051C078E|nr:exopolyphosphatase [Selenomonas sp. ND2010]
MLHGIIDIGSNTVRMAIYLIEGSHIEMLLKKKHTVGLAGYLREGVMQQQGIDKAVEILEEFKSFLELFRITNVSAFTTAALRNAKNSQEAVRQIEERTGLTIRVITGDEEATFDFIGATRTLQSEDGLLIDIGGGSTEIVTYRQRKIEHKTSLPIGSLAFRTQYVKGLLPTLTECMAMRAAAEEIIASADAFADTQVDGIAGIGGTVKGASALYNILFNQPAANTRMETKRLRTIIGNFVSDHEMTQEMTIALMRAVPDRMHTIIPGLVIADVLARRFKAKVITYSDSGVREGYIYDQIIGR